MVNADIVQKMTDCIVENFAPHKVIAFGSWVRGEANNDSGIDFLIVLPYQGSKRDCQVSIRRTLKDFDVSKDVLVISPEELDKMKSVNGYIYQTAISEGKILYEY